MAQAGQQQKVDINAASVEDLEALSGIGHNRAVAIYDARKTSGGFAAVGDLLKITGIGPAILEQNLGLLICSTLGGNNSATNRKCERETRSTLHLRSDSNPSSPSAVVAVPAAAGSATSRHESGHGLRSNSGAAMCATPLTPVCSGGGKGKRRTKARTDQGALRHSLRHCAVEEGGAETKDGDSAAMACDTAESPDSDNDPESDMPCSAGVATPLAASKNGAAGAALSTKRVPATRSRRLHPIDSSPSPTSPSSSTCTSASSSLPCSCPPSNQSDGSTAHNSMECQDQSPLHINTDPESMEHLLGDSTPDVSIGQDDPFKTEIASSIQVLEKHLMKRKSNGEEAKELSPGKKPCWADDSSFGNCELAGDGPSGSFPSLRSTLSGSGVQTAALLRKQRIPSRSNPPPQLADWLRTFQGWSHAERLLALDEMIEQCEPTQVRHIMAVIEPQFQRDFISLLPKELALYVLSFLEPNALLHAAQTCRYWHILAEDNLLWREKCREEGINEATVFENRIRTRSGSISNSYARSPWKCLYLRQNRIEHNWRIGEIPQPKVLKGHDDHVITCLEFCGTRIVSGSDDNTLKVWSAVTGKCLRSLVGHTGGVWSSQMANNIIISGSTDRTLKVWNADTGQCIHTLYGHTSTVRCMHLYNNQVVSGSRDATLRLWDVDSGQCLHVLMGHVAAVRCVQYNGQRVVSGAYDYMVKVWDPDTEQCLFTMQGHTNRVYSLQFDGTHIVSGSLDTTIRVWDAETGNCVRTLLGHQSLTSGMELKDNILVSGNADSTVKVWDITTGQCLQTLQGSNKHQSAVTCLQFNKKFVITSSDDGTVKIWCLRTGDFLRNLVALDSGGSGGVVWRIRSTNTKLVCAVGSRNGTEETKLLVLDFDVEDTDSTPYRKRLDSCGSVIETRV